jgi:hypothetical protein
MIASMSEISRVHNSEESLVDDGRSWDGILLEVVAPDIHLDTRVSGTICSRKLDSLW